MFEGGGVGQVVVWCGVRAGGGKGRYVRCPYHDLSASQTVEPAIT